MNGGRQTASMTVCALMGVQAVLGLAFPERYRDVAWIRATWYGNDWVTLVVAVPLFVLVIRASSRGSPRGRLGVVGVLFYAAYNYAFYLFGAALNIFFPLYVGLLLLSTAALVMALRRLDPDVAALRLQRWTPVRAIGGYMLVVGAVLGSVWVGIWAAFIFAGRPTPIEPDAFQLVAALDLTLIVPALCVGGVWLWRHRPWGYVVATASTTQAALYLTVLAVNAVVARTRGLQGSQELPLWSILAATMAAASLALFAGISGRSARH